LGSAKCDGTVLQFIVSGALDVSSGLTADDYSFQEVQELSAIQASLRILPSMIIAVFLNFATGYMIDKIPAFWLLLVTMTMTAGAPLLMALIQPQSSYWKGAFFAQVLVPLGGDVLFTVGLIVVSDVFPERTQALAGAVYNTVAYFGLSLGINLMQVVSLWVTKGTQYRDKSSSAARLQGYQASFWAMFATTIACATICMFGLRKIGKVGLKRE
jgi:MFS family permease